MASQRKGRAFYACISNSKYLKCLLFYDCILMELVQDFKHSSTRKLFKSMEIRKTMYVERASNFKSAKKVHGFI
jgi:hypothetical protein